MLTLEELKEYIAQNYDECLICDLLEISSEELVAVFEDKVIEKRRQFDDE